MARTFSAGAYIPADVTTVRTNDGEILYRVNADGFAASRNGHPWGTNNTGPDGNGAWGMNDFPLTEIVGGL